MRVEKVKARKLARLESLTEERDDLIRLRDKLRSAGTRKEILACRERLHLVHILIARAIKPTQCVGLALARWNEESLKNQRKRQSETLTFQTAKHKPWTDEEDAFVLESDLTDFEIALELGRTLCGVKSRRFNLRKNS